MKNGTSHEHLNAERLQAFLDRELPSREHARVEEHLKGCAPCSVEYDAWCLLFEDLEDLASPRPHQGFADRVMADVRIPESLPLVARVRAGLGALLAGSPTEHLEAARLQDFLDGMLPARQMARAQAHLAGCAPCSAEVDGWRTLLSRLERLERLAPSRHFAERVMAGVRIPSSAPALAKPPVWAQALAHARRVVPRTRTAWAAISGVAVTPAVTAGLVFYAVFSHPTLTLEALASFVWWQVTDVAALGWTTLSGAVLESAQLFDAYSLFEMLASAPFALAGGLLAYSVTSALALRVLYRNLIVNRPPEGRYAHVSAS